MARSITTRSTNPKIMDDNIKILDDALASASAPEASDVSYDNTDSGLTADNVQAAIDTICARFTTYQTETATATIEAGGYHDFTWELNAGSIFAGYSLSNVASANVSVLAAYIGADGNATIRVKNNGAADITNAGAYIRFF